MRGQARQTWVKIHIAGWLHGSIRYQLNSAERGVWADLIVMAGQCLQGGRICDNDGRAYPMDYIASQFHIPLALLESTIAKCEKEGRIEVKDGVIHITNWSAYQSEYERQKKYRDKPADFDNPDKFIEGKYGKSVRR